MSRVLERLRINSVQIVSLEMSLNGTGISQPVSAAVEIRKSARRGTRAVTMRRVPHVLLKTRRVHDSTYTRARGSAVRVSAYTLGRRPSCSASEQRRRRVRYVAGRHATSGARRPVSCFLVRSAAMSSVFHRRVYSMSGNTFSTADNNISSIAGRANDDDDDGGEEKKSDKRKRKRRTDRTVNARCHGRGAKIVSRVPCYDYVQQVKINTPD